MAPYGYDAGALNTARALYEDAQALVTVQRREYGEQYAATEALQQAWAATDAAYTRALKLARVALKENMQAQAALGLTGRRKESLSGWMDQAEVFYQGLLAKPALLAEMARFGYDQAKVEGEAAMVAVVRAANAAQEQEKGDAQEATKIRDARLDELDDWMADFKAVAEVALEESPQQLEKMGFGPVP